MENEVNEIKIRYTEKLGIFKSESLNCADKVAAFLYTTWDKDNIAVQECFKLLLINNNNKVKGVCQLSAGGISSTLVDLRLLFAVTLKSLATAIILAHNHPSGKAKPSSADIDLTQKVKRAAELFDIKVLDHLIILPDGNFYSFANEGIL